MTPETSAPSYTEAVFFVVESDALNQAGDFLGDRLVKTCGIHLLGGHATQEILLDALLVYQPALCSAGAS